MSHSGHITSLPVDLPYDIERAIIESAAYHDQPLAKKLVGLTKEVQSWIDPILYRHVKIEYPSQAEAFIHTLQSSSKGVEFFARNVKTLCFSYGVSLEQVARILSVCTNVKSLASWIEFSQNTNLENNNNDVAPTVKSPYPKELQQFLANESSQLRRLSIILQDFFGTSDPDFSLPVVQNLTHLDIYQGSEHFKTWSWSCFQDLASLTYLSFDLSISSPLEIISNLIPKFPKALQVCLVLLSTRDGTTTLENFFSENKELHRYITGEVDSRVVIGTTEELDEEYRHDGLVIIHPYEEVVKDWTYTPDGKDDIWEKALQVIIHRNAEKKRKEEEEKARQKNEESSNSSASASSLL